MNNSAATRKLTTIFYADVAGYSRLTGDDELRTHQEVMSVLDYANQTIGSMGGTVLRYAGDAILAEFTSVVSCVDASVDIQSELASRNRDAPDDKKVQLRIGINLGEVLSDRGEIYGDGVNIAARLESIAVPGGICISRKVGAEVTGKIQVEFSDGGVHQLKNITDPIGVMHWHPDIEVPLPEGKSAVIDGSGSGAQPIPGRGRLLLAVGIAVLLAVGAAAWFINQPSAPTPAAGKLGVRYVLNGSAQHSGNRVRVNVELVI